MTRGRLCAAIGRAGQGYKGRRGGEGAVQSVLIAERGRHGSAGESRCPAVAAGAGWAGERGRGAEGGGVLPQARRERRGERSELLRERVLPAADQHHPPQERAAHERREARGHVLQRQVALPAAGLCALPAPARGHLLLQGGALCPAGAPNLPVGSRLLSCLG